MKRHCCEKAGPICPGPKGTWLSHPPEICFNATHFCFVFLLLQHSIPNGLFGFLSCPFASDSQAIPTTTSHSEHIPTQACPYTETKLRWFPSLTHACGDMCFSPLLPGKASWRSLAWQQQPSIWSLGVIKGRWRFICVPGAHDLRKHIDLSEPPWLSLQNERDKMVEAFVNTTLGSDCLNTPVFTFFLPFLYSKANKPGGASSAPKSFSLVSKAMFSSSFSCFNRVRPRQSDIVWHTHSWLHMHCAHTCGREDTHVARCPFLWKEESSSDTSMSCIFFQRS